MIKLFKWLLLLMLAFCLAACANNITVKKVSTTAYPPLTPYDSVIIFSKDSEVKGPFEIIATLEFSNAGKYRRLELIDALEPLKAAAREIGANGIIIDKTDSIWSGIVSRGISVEGRAIHHDHPEKPNGEKQSSKARLQELNEMLKDKLISPEDYELKKMQILNSL